MLSFETIVSMAGWNQYILPIKMKGVLKCLWERVFLISKQQKGFLCIDHTKLLKYCTPVVFGYGLDRSTQKNHVH